MDISNVPLGLPATEEVPTEYLTIDVNPMHRRLFNPVKLTEHDFALSFDRNTEHIVPVHKVFDPRDEERKIRMCHSIDSLAEPVQCLLTAMRSAGEPYADERLPYTPSVLDFYSEQLRVSPKKQTVSSEPVSTLTDLGSDSCYVSTLANIEPDEEVPAVPLAAVAVSAEQIAHSPVAYDLSGSVPWANYTGDSYTPISPMDIRFHRIHACSLNFDKAGETVWNVCAPKPDPPMPSNGTCPFRNSAQLSLSSGKFLLIESVEQFPLLMHFHGMSGGIYRYYRSPKKPIGSLGSLVPLTTEFLPKAFGGNVVKIESACTMLESSLLRAPLFVHKPHATDFLLVRYQGPKKTTRFVLRPIEALYCAGQAEPLYRVDVPVVPRLHQVLSSRVLLEGRRFWLRAKSQPTLEFLALFFAGERRSLLTRYFADSIRDIQQRPGAPLVATLTPEEAAVVNAMKEGIRRLAERGIERITAISPMRIRNYVRDIEVFERSMPLASRTPRIAHLCVQLENEMRQSVWNLTNDYWDVLTGKRGAMFQFSPLGEPSGGRGEGISFRKILKVDGVSAEEALGAIAGARKFTGPKLEHVRSKTKKELIEELQKLNVPDRVWRTMSRWQLMRQLILLLGIEDESEERLAPWKRKALHSERIDEAWKKQFKALSDKNVVSDSFTPPESVSEDELEAGMLADLQTEETTVEDAPMGPSLLRLQIVSTGRVKSTGTPWSKVTYVYGAKNIALYRKWKELEEEGTSIVVEDEGGPPAWHAKVEMSLKVHRRFQRILRQAAEAGQPIPDIKRCGACHLFGHDASYEGCPMLVREMDATTNPLPKRKRSAEQSPIYD